MSRAAFSSERINALSDGVFAIAMTLLVFNIQIPDLGDIDNRETFERAIAGQLPHLVSWLLSFAILCRLWITHNHLMRDHPKKSAGFTACNFVLLGAVALIPFPASLLGEHPDQAWSVIILSATYGVAALAMAGMWRVAPARGSKQAKMVLGVSLLTMLAALLASLVALIHPYLGISVWAIYLVGSMQLGRVIARTRGAHRHRSAKGE